MVRRYEQWGFLPPAERSPTGHRLYTSRHLDAIRTVRVLIEGYTWQHALKVMQAVHAGDLTLALTLVDERHARLDRERREVQANLEALRRITASGLAAVAASDGAGPAPGGPPGRPTHMRIGEAARQVGVEVSAVRFWEEQGLLEPVRDTSSGYRMYDAHQLFLLQVIVLLRRADYDFDAIRPVLDGLEQGRPERALKMAERRLRKLARSSLRCARATAALYAYIEGADES